MLILKTLGPLMRQRTYHDLAAGGTLPAPDLARVEPLGVQRTPLCFVSRDRKRRTRRVAGFMIDGKFDDVVLPLLHQTLVEAFKKSVDMKGCAHSFSKI